MINERRSVLVTGCSGFIGRALAEQLLTEGWYVIGAARTDPKIANASFEYRRLDLCEEPLSPLLFDGVDAFIHAALIAQSAKRDAVADNVNAAMRLLEAARSQKVTKGIYLSSMAASENALSDYGKQKFAIEALFSASGYMNVRPGLVIGDGGLFRSLARSLKARRIVPLIDGGRQALETIFLDDCVEILSYNLSVPRQDGTFAITSNAPILFREFYTELAQCLSVEPLFIPVPFQLADYSLAAAEWLRVTLPINRDNLLGLRAMRANTIERLTRPVVSLRGAKESIRIAVARAGQI